MNYSCFQYFVNLFYISFVTNKIILTYKLFSFKTKSQKSKASEKPTLTRPSKKQFPTLSKTHITIWWRVFFDSETMDLRSGRQSHFLRADPNSRRHADYADYADDTTINPWYMIWWNIHRPFTVLVIQLYQPLWCWGLECNSCQLKINIFCSLNSIFNSVSWFTIYLLFGIFISLNALI